MKLKITGKSTTVEVEVPDWKVDIEIENSIGDDIVQDYWQVYYKNLREKNNDKTSD